jgi:hypothetical protein
LTGETSEKTPEIGFISKFDKVLDKKQKLEKIINSPNSANSAKIVIQNSKKKTENGSY